MIMKKILNDPDVEFLLEYTGMGDIIHEPLAQTPVVWLNHDGKQLHFVTLLSDFMRKK
jgi:hypothetical protein